MSRLTSNDGKQRMLFRVVGGIHNIHSPSRVLQGLASYSGCGQYHALISVHLQPLRNRTNTAWHVPLPLRRPRLGGTPSKCWSSWLPDGNYQIFRLYVFGPSDLKDYVSTMLRCKICHLATLLTLVWWASSPLFLVMVSLIPD